MIAFYLVDVSGIAYQVHQIMKKIKKFTLLTDSLLKILIPRPSVYEGLSFIPNFQFVIFGKHK
jgi:hypothetical protein